jgi:hypothetical protein
MSLTAAEQPNVSTITLQNRQTFDVKSYAGKKLDSLPVIDVSGIYSEDFEKRKAVAEQIRAAAHETGFFYAINHVTPPVSRRSAFTDSVGRALIQNIRRTLSKLQNVSLNNPCRRKWKFVRTSFQMSTLDIIHLSTTREVGGRRKVRRSPIKPKNLF